MLRYTVKDALKEMMDGWDKIEAAAKKEFPTATKEELYVICKGAMNKALKIEDKGGINPCLNKTIYSHP